MTAHSFLLQHSLLDLQHPGSNTVLLFIVYAMRCSAPLLMLVLKLACARLLLPPHRPRSFDAMVVAILERSLPSSGLVLLCEEGARPEGGTGSGVQLSSRWPVLATTHMPVATAAGYAVDAGARREDPSHVCYRPLARRAAAVVLRGSFSYVARTFLGLRSECAGLWNSSALLLIMLPPG